MRASTMKSRLSSIASRNSLEERLREPIRRPTTLSPGCNPQLGVRHIQLKMVLYASLPQHNTPQHLAHNMRNTLLGSWHDGVIMSIDTLTDGEKVRVSYNVVFMDSGVEEDLKARYIKAPRADGWAAQMYERKNSSESTRGGEDGGINAGNGLAQGNGDKKKKHKGPSFLPWSKKE